MDRLGKILYSILFILIVLLGFSIYSYATKTDIRISSSINDKKYLSDAEINRLQLASITAEERAKYEEAYALIPIEERPEPLIYLDELYQSQRYFTFGKLPFAFTNNLQTGEGINDVTYSFSAEVKTELQNAITNKDANAIYCVFGDRIESAPHPTLVVESLKKVEILVEGNYIKIKDIPKECDNAIGFVRPLIGTTEAENICKELYPTGELQIVAQEIGRNPADVASAINAACTSFCQVPAVDIYSLIQNTRKGYFFTGVYCDNGHSAGVITAIEHYRNKEKLYIVNS